MDEDYIVMGRIKDRGIKKWQGMMLTEHVKMISEWKEEEGKMKMTAIPKPKDTKKSVAGPKLTEYDFIEIGEKINEALEFKNEVEITTYHQKQYESARGVITNADGQIGKLTMQVGYEEIKININSIVSIK